MIEEDWKDRTVFTPEKVADPQQIYEIDKVIYAFNHQPITSTVCLLSFLILMGFIIFWVRKKFRNHRET